MVSKRKWVIVILASHAILVLYPFKITVVPEKRVLVMTNDMHPVRDALVRQSWQNYSLEREGHEEDLPTDAHGRVTFPTRTIRAPLVWRLLGPLASIAGQGVHASFGVRTDMFPCLILGRKFHPKLHGRNQAKLCLGNDGIQQSLAADGAIAWFSRNFFPSTRMLIARRS